MMRYMVVYNSVFILIPFSVILYKLTKRKKRVSWNMITFIGTVLKVVIVYFDLAKFITQFSRNFL